MGSANARLGIRPNDDGHHIIGRHSRFCGDDDIKMKTIYLDYNATTPLRPEVLGAMLPYLKEDYGNASSLNQLGQKARKAVEEARSKIAQLIHAEDPEEIILTSCATESNNTAVRGVLSANKHKGNRMVSSAIEHSSVRNVLRFMEQAGEIENIVVPTQPEGLIRPADIKDALTAHTIMVSVMAANNEVGTIQPIKEIAKLCRDKEIIFHTDAVQLAGKHEIDVNDLGVDLLSLSAHKFGGPKGVGILYIRKGTRLDALLHGGSHEKNRRAGTENVAGIVGMGRAAELAALEFKSEQIRIGPYRDQFEKTLLSTIPESFLNGDVDRRICNTTNIGFECTESTKLLMALDLAGVACSNGSACSTGSVDASHVLLAMGLSQEKAHASLRFSLGHSTSESELKTAAEIIKETVSRVRESHPLWKKASLR